MSERDSAADAACSSAAKLQAAQIDAVSLDAIIRASVTANLSVDGDTEREVAELVHNAIDGLLAAAQNLSAKLVAKLDGVDVWRVQS